MLSCVTKEEFVDFTIQIIEKSMGIFSLDQNKENIQTKKHMCKYKSPSIYEAENQGTKHTGNSIFFIHCHWS